MASIDALAHLAPEEVAGTASGTATPGETIHPPVPGRVEGFKYRYFLVYPGGWQFESSLGPYQYLMSLCTLKDLNPPGRRAGRVLSGRDAIHCPSS